MKIHIKNALVALVCLAVFASPTKPADGGTSLKDQFLTEGPKGWAKLKAATRNLEGSGVLTEIPQIPDKKLPRRVSSWRVKVNNSLILFERNQIDENGKQANGIVGASNPQYSFFLNRDQPSSSWLLKRVGTEKNPMTTTHPYFMAWGMGFVRYLEAPWTVAGMPLPMMVAEQGFVLEQISELEQEGKRYVKVEFRYSPPGDRKQIRPGAGGKPVELTPHDTQMRGGWILFDPNRHWAIVKYDLRVLGWDKTSGTVQYSEDSPIPLVRRVFEESYVNQKGGKTSQFVFEKLVQRDIPESEFTLSAFGLREPNLEQPASRRIPLWVWFISGGAVCLVSALLLVWRMRVIRSRSALERAG